MSIEALIESPSHTQAASNPSELPSADEAEQASHGLLERVLRAADATEGSMVGERAQRELARHRQVGGE